MKINRSDIDFMQRAIQLALIAKGRTSPNPLVGAVIVKDNQILAEGWHHRCGADHAEIEALKQLGFSARGATLYLPLEPCFHFGHTPPCVDAVIESGIKEVVIGMKDPNPLTHGKSIAKLRQAGIRVKVGVLQKECERLNEVFIKYMTQHLPFVVGKSAQTIDGKIATAHGDSKWITSKEARDLAHQRRDEFDAILVGYNTVLKDNPRLNGASQDKILKKIVLDSKLRISLKAKLFEGVDLNNCFIATTVKASSLKIKSFEKKGIRVLVCPTKNGRIRLKWLFKELAKNEIASILIEGGAQALSGALKENTVDKLQIYIAPKILGDEKAVSSFVGLKASGIHQMTSLENVTFEKIGSDFFIQGYVHRNH